MDVVEYSVPKYAKCLYICDRDDDGRIWIHLIFDAAFIIAIV
jgi:hypothetical protein